MPEEKVLTKSKILIRIIVFILLGVMLVAAVNNIVTNGGDYRIRQLYGSFYKEEKNSLDAVFLGASTTYAYWSPPLAWERYGITVGMFSCPEQPFEAAEYVIKEARKTQPDALYIVPITSNNTTKSLGSVELHYLSDYMPLSLNKIQMVRTLGGYLNFDLADQMEYIFPFIRFHTRWSELEERDFYYPLEGIKGASYYTNFLRTSEDVTSSYRTTNRTAPLSEMSQTALESLLNYCDEEQLNVLFIAVPRIRANETMIAQVNTIKETVQERGYTILDLRESVDEIGLDLTQDYYNAAHTNIHGAVKMTNYISEYLIENYGFEDKRGDTKYSSWDEAYDKYTDKYASAYTLDVEWNSEPRDNSLSAPKLSSVSVKGNSLTVSWENVSGADGYRIYRKAGLAKKWEEVGDADANTLTYTDGERKAGTTYYYTVIPYRDENGVRYWGKYDYAGVSAKALLNAPELVSLEGSENDLSLTWEPVDGADGYSVFRRLPTKTWAEIKNVGNKTTYTDTDMLSNMPYSYTVKAYFLDGNGNRVMSSFDTTGLFYIPELELSKPEAAVAENGAIDLSWENLEGVGGYRIFRRTKNSQWEKVNSADLPSDSTFFRDITAQAGVTYSYKVEAFIKTGSDEYKNENQSDWITTDKSLYDISMPKIIYLEQTYDKVHIVWNEVNGASCYEIYRRTKAKDGRWSEWESIQSSVQETDYMDTPSKAGEYEYAVRSVFNFDGLTYYGQFNKTAGYGIEFSPASN